MPPAVKISQWGHQNPETGQTQSIKSAVQTLMSQKWGSRGHGCRGSSQAGTGCIFTAVEHMLEALPASEPASLLPSFLPPPPFIQATGGNPSPH